MSEPKFKNIFDSKRTIAVIGISNNDSKPAYQVAAFLQDAGYKIVPINPACEETLGEKCYPTLTDIPFPVDVVDVFRRSEFAPDIAREAVKIGAKVLWLQDSVISEEAEQIAKDAGITFVQNDCMKRQLMRLL